MNEDARAVDAARLGLSPPEATLSVRQYARRVGLGVRDRCSFEDFVLAYAAGLHADSGHDAALGRLYGAPIPDRWRLILAALDVAADEMPRVVEAFRAKETMGLRQKASFNDFAAAFVAGVADKHSASVGFDARAALGPARPDDGARDPLGGLLPLNSSWQDLLPQDYKRWNQAIAEEFLGPAHALRPVYLPVDAECLQRIAQRRAWNIPSAESDFIEAARSVIRLGHGSFAKPLQWLRSDVRFTATPPFIAVLGLSVLAASRMATGAHVTASNYYDPLADLVQFPRQTVLQSFPQVVDGWLALNKWLDDTHRGQFGRSTARPIEGFTRIGYPISQCMLREQDIRRLPAFFRWASLIPEDQPPTSVLVSLLAEWAKTSSSRLSAFGRRSVQGASTRMLVGELVARELELWSGEIETESDSTTQRAARLWLGLEGESSRRVELFLIAQRPPGFPEQLTLKRVGLPNLELAANNEDAPWYEPVPFLGSLLARAEWTSGGGDLAARFEPSEIIALAPDEDLGLWRQVARLELEQDGLVLASPQQSLNVAAALSLCARPGFAQVQPAGLPQDWVAFINVRPVRALVKAEGALRCLSPQANLGVSLSGGLRLTSNTWLSGGEPTLHVRTVTGQQIQGVFVDDRLVYSVPPEGASYELASLDLAAGLHSVRVGERRLVFFTRAGSDPPSSRAECEAITIRVDVPEDADASASRGGPLGTMHIRGAEVWES